MTYRDFWNVCSAIDFKALSQDERGAGDSSSAGLCDAMWVVGDNGGLFCLIGSTIHWQQLPSPWF